MHATYTQHRCNAHATSVQHLHALTRTTQHRCSTHPASSQQQCSIRAASVQHPCSIRAASVQRPRNDHAAAGAAHGTLVSASACALASASVAARSSPPVITGCAYRRLSSSAFDLVRARIRSFFFQFHFLWHGVGRTLPNRGRPADRGGAGPRSVVMPPFNALLMPFFLPVYAV